MTEVDRGRSGKAKLDQGLEAGFGLWRLGSGLWALGSGGWALGAGLWILSYFEHPRLDSDLFGAPGTRFEPPSPDLSLQGWI